MCVAPPFPIYIGTLKLQSILSSVYLSAFLFAFHSILSSLTIQLRREKSHIFAYTVYTTEFTVFQFFFEVFFFMVLLRGQNRFLLLML